MPCETCEKKLTKIIAVDPYRNKAHNKTLGGGVNKANPSGKKNKWLHVDKKQFQTDVRCKLCKLSVHQFGAHYCQNCAYQKGICGMCGKRLIKTANLKQTNV